MRRALLLYSVCALEITSHIKNYYVARDSSVTLNCEFVFESENLGYTEIAWNIVPSDKQQDDKIIIWYTGGVIYSNLYEKLKNRVHFLTDMGTYQCKVKRLPEFGMKIFNLFVMERPSTPVCYIDGEAEEGNNLRIRCRSSQGTPPLGYNWSKANGNKMLPQSAFVDTIAGDLYLRKITESARKNSKTCTNSKTIMAVLNKDNKLNDLRNTHFISIRSENVVYSSLDCFPWAHICGTFRGCFDIALSFNRSNLAAVAALNSV
uniref:Ig-like domain-containing protein n=1 Tax=Maylandia zebra TaxID=106582 RepID=A0A3P9CPS7_9CICH